jgi:hypothetical protein
MSGRSGMAKQGMVARSCCHRLHSLLACVSLIQANADPSVQLNSHCLLPPHRKRSVSSEKDPEPAKSRRRYDSRDGERR